MADTPEQITQTAAAVEDTPEELAELIAELEQYRQRLLNDTMEMAQRAKIMRAQAIASLEPDLARIDAMLQELRDRQAALSANN
jgi:DNA repair exonuclease SbcCD ATPase subunit